MQSISKNESGIALLLVISSLVVITMLTVEFAYNAEIEYQMALRNRQRTQAYFLAMSAYQLTLLELKMQGPIQSQIQKATQALGEAGIELPIDSSAPLCQQFPMKTALFRLAQAGGGLTKKEGESSEAENPLAGFALSGLEEFLQFTGDFEGECVDESSKINLNYFYGMDPAKQMLSGDNPYDDLKKIIMKVLDNPDHRKKIEESDLTPHDVVQNIADWIDENESVNNFGGSEGGGEDSRYRGGLPGQMTSKNGKLSTPQDIFRVAGVMDAWWIPVSESFTIYGSSSEGGKMQINVCQAPDSVVKALILRYVESRKEIPPLRPEDSEVVDQLVSAVQEGCGGEVDKNEIAKALEDALFTLLKVPPQLTGAAAGEEAKGKEEKEEKEEGETGEAEKKSGSGDGAAQSPFAEWITTESRFFSLKLTGQVKETVVKIDAVIDLGEKGGSDTARWKLLYWKIY